MLDAFLSTNQGMAALVEIKPKLNHSCFRLLFELSGCPGAGRFEAETDMLARHCKMSVDEILECVTILRFIHGINITADQTIVWRLAK